MGRWNDLPFEVNCAILQYAVENVAHCCDSNAYFWMDSEENTPRACFRNFRSILLPCREVWQPVTDDIKVDGIAIIMHLQTIQYELFTALSRFASRTGLYLLD